MARPIKFRTKGNIFRIENRNRCIICGRIISLGKIICNSCSNRNRFTPVRGSSRARGTTRRTL